MGNSVQREFFPSFAWAMPKAYRVPLATCRFEQGDLLYDTPLAYEGCWEDALRHLKFSIQLLSPMRGPVVKVEEDTDSVFSDNWPQQVFVDLTDYASKTTRTIETTQGRLYTTLWHGDLQQLEGDSTEPAIPVLPLDIVAKEQRHHLAAVASHCIAKHCEGVVQPCVFIMPFDETHDILQDKLARIHKVLSIHPESRHRLVFESPIDAGLNSPVGFVPTMQLACFLLDNIEPEIAFAWIKEALYVPAKNRKTDREFFRMEPHGYLYPKVKAGLLLPL